MLRGLNELSEPSRRHLLYILEAGGPTDNENPYSLREIADFLVGVDEYIDGAADIAMEFAEVAREAGIDIQGGTDDMPDEDEIDDEELEDEDDEEETDDEDEDEDEDDDDEDEDEDNSEPPKRKAKKAAPKKKAKAVKKTAKTKKAPAKKKPAEKPAKQAKKAKRKAASGDRNTPIRMEERIPELTDALSKMKDGGTINELYHHFSKTKGGRDLFPTRRSVKRVLVACEGEEFARSTPTIWHPKASGAKKAKKAKAKKK